MGSVQSAGEATRGNPDNTLGEVSRDDEWKVVVNRANVIRDTRPPKPRSLALRRANRYLAVWRDQEVM